jgi:hypothetical protein
MTKSKVKMNFPKTVEGKLDLIWDRCKRNMSDFSYYEKDGHWLAGDRSYDSGPLANAFTRAVIEDFANLKPTAKNEQKL